MWAQERSVKIFNSSVYNEFIKYLVSEFWKIKQFNFFLRVFVIKLKNYVVSQKCDWYIKKHDINNDQSIVVAFNKCNLAKYYECN